MTKKLSQAAEDAIAQALAQRRSLTLKRLCEQWGVDKITLYRAAQRSRRRTQRAVAT